jgi:3D (Asp-Asp-Asp) domain-containing protein
MANVEEIYEGGIMKLKYINKINKNIVEILILIVALIGMFISIHILHEYPKKINKPKKVVSNQPALKEDRELLVQYKIQQNKKMIQQRMAAEKTQKTKEREVNEAQKPKPYSSKFKAVVTAYTAYEESTGKTPSHPTFGITASGKRVKQGVTVACPPHIELGTWIEIEGIGKRRCDDRGGAIKGNKIDVYMKRVDEAIKFGKQERMVYILK